MNEQDLATILHRLPPEELLCQLGEECGELAQAALKLRRARTDKNPTPRTREECMDAKAARWAKRLEAAR